MKLGDFFGMDLSARVFQVDHYADLLGVRGALADNPQVLAYQADMTRHGSAALYLFKRLLILRMLQVLLTGPMLSFDSHYDAKKLAAGSSRDRRYGAEEKLLAYALIVATGKSENQLKAEQFHPTVRALREWPQASRFKHLERLLIDSNPALVEAHAELFRSAGHSRHAVWLQRLRHWLLGG